MGGLSTTIGLPPLAPRKSRRKLSQRGRQETIKVVSVPSELRLLARLSVTGIETVKTCPQLVEESSPRKAMLEHLGMSSMVKVKYPNGNIKMLPKSFAVSMGLEIVCE